MFQNFELGGKVHYIYVYYFGRHRLTEYGQEIAKKYKFGDLITGDGYLDSKCFYQLSKVSRRFR